MRKLLLLLVLLQFTACTTDEERFEQEIAEIQEFVDTNNLDFETTASGLFYHIEQAGNPNRVPDSTHYVSFKHVGYFLDSTKFSEGWYPSDHIPLPYLVPGFQEGLQLVGEGGRGVVIMPSSLGYGDEAKGSIPAHSILMFRLELVSYQ